MSARTHIERVQIDDLACWRLQGPAGELLISEQGAQILQYQEWQQPPLLWLSESAEYREGQSLRGGVPLCWPWFGDLKRNPEAVQQMLSAGSPSPAHGLVRQQEWQVLNLEDAGDEVRFSLGFYSDGQLTGWPHIAELQLDIVLGQRLEITLTCRNTGERDLHISQALHSYFAVGDIRQVQLEGLKGCDYIETLDNWKTLRQKGALGFEGETDRIYLDTPSQLSILDPVWQRRIHLHAEGSGSTVVWNPWIEKAKRLSQFAEDDWQQMLCIETANVLDDALHMAPGSEHQLHLSLWSETL